MTAYGLTYLLTNKQGSKIYVLMIVIVMPAELRCAWLDGARTWDQPSRAVKSDSTRHVIFVHMYVSESKGSGHYQAGDTEFK